MAVFWKISVIRVSILIIPVLNLGIEVWRLVVEPPNSVSPYARRLTPSAHRASFFLGLAEAFVQLQGDGFEAGGGLGGGFEVGVDLAGLLHGLVAHGDPSIIDLGGQGRDNSAESVRAK